MEMLLVIKLVLSASVSTNTSGIITTALGAKSCERSSLEAGYARESSRNSNADRKFISNVKPNTMLYNIKRARYSPFARNIRAGPIGRRHTE